MSDEKKTRVTHTQSQSSDSPPRPKTKDNQSHKSQEITSKNVSSSASDKAPTPKSKNKGVHQHSNTSNDTQPSALSRPSQNQGGPKPTGLNDAKDNASKKDGRNTDPKDTSPPQKTPSGDGKDTDDQDKPLVGAKDSDGQDQSSDDPSKDSSKNDDKQDQDGNKKDQDDDKQDQDSDKKDQDASKTSSDKDGKDDQGKSQDGKDKSKDGNDKPVGPKGDDDSPNAKKGIVGALGGAGNKAFSDSLDQGGGSDKPTRSDKSGAFKGMGKAGKKAAKEGGKSILLGPFLPILLIIGLIGIVALISVFSAFISTMSNSTEEELINGACTPTSTGGGGPNGEGGAVFDPNLPIGGSELSLKAPGWNQPGHARYEAAKTVFDAFVNAHGTSGAFAAGVLANGVGESTLLLDMAQGGDVNHGRFGMDNPVMPAGYGPGGGFFQYDPHTNFTESPYWRGRPGSKGWDALNQVDAVWYPYFDNRVIEQYLYSSNPGWGAASYGKYDEVMKAFPTLEEFLSTEDPEKAAMGFLVGFERPAAYHPERERWARELNDFFNKDNIKADPSKWNLGGGSGDPVAGGSNGSTQTGDGSCNNSSGNLASNGDIIDTARQYMEYFQYHQLHSLSIFKDWDNPPKGAWTDCSGYVWFILHKTGKYSVPPAMGWFTGSMEEDAKGEQKYLKVIKKEEAKAGDVVIYNANGGAGNDGHTGFLAEDWHGPDTKVIHHGSGWGAQETEFKWAFYRFSTDYPPSVVRETFARAIPLSEVDKK